MRRSATVPHRLMLSGPAGAGKTYSALQIGGVLGERVLVIDTEKESALTYADEFTFDHLPWRPPFDPRDLAKDLVEASASYDVIIVDSFTHFWTGSGGTLDIADGKFGGWKTARPAQEDVTFGGLLSTSAHVIICCRAKMEYLSEEYEDKGRKRQRVTKIGLAPRQDGELEYELNLAAEIDIDHRISISKSRTTAVPVGSSFTAGHADELAKNYAAWLESGEPFADLEVRAAVDRARAALSSEQKKQLWQAWQANGLPGPAQVGVQPRPQVGQGRQEAVAHHRGRLRRARSHTAAERQSRRHTRRRHARQHAGVRPGA